VIAALPLARNMRSPRFLALALALVITGAALVVPVLPFTRTGAEILAIVDITGSMNVRDYARVGRPESRLDRAKAALRRLVADLPCGSRLALGLFTERQPFLLFEPIETGLYRAIDMAAGLGTDLVFITDGQEAPPLPGGGPPMFEGRPGAVRGLIVGAGGYALSPIPRYDDRGREKGFYGEADVQQESRFGPPPADAETREGYNPRNAPFGSAAAQGTEHLSSVREPYLKRLAAATGLAYAHLDGPGDLQAPLRAAVTPRALLGALNPRPFLGALALVLVLATLSAGQAAALRRRLPPFLSHTENT
jgi:mxaL protein